MTDNDPSLAALGVAADGRAPLADLIEQARVAEAAGAQTLWIACHLFLRDPIASAAVVLGATRRLKVALMAVSPYAMHPVFIAMSAATLDEAYPGRVVLCLGVGAPGDLAAAGIPTPKPLATLRESIRICRSLFAGETVAHHGERFTVAGRRLPNPTDRIPIVLAASRPQMLALAGEVADGVLISAATAPAFVRWCLEQVDQGVARRERPGACARIAIVYTRIADDEATAVAGLRRTLGFILRGPHHAKNVELAGQRLDQQALWDAYRDENWAEVERLITADVVRAHAAAGTAAQLGARYRAYRALGLDEIVVGGVDDPVQTGRVLAAIGSPG